MSGAVDDDVARSAAEARETLGAMLSAAQSHLQKVFVVFVVGLLLSIWALRRYVWTWMKADLNANPDITVIAVTPFDVILLQVKIGLVVGVLLALPPLIYYSRDALRERGWWPSQYVPRWKLAAGALVSLALFVGGIAYGYFLFFPLAFDFLASNATAAGFKPTYSIVKWAEFIFLLSLSFGLAAQLPLVMSALSYARIVPYETWRKYWKHALVALYALGALFTPPDPLTQLMWATPLAILYGASLLVTKFVVTVREAGERIGARRVARRRWNVIAGVALVVGVAVYALGVALVTGRVDPYLQRLPYVEVTFAGAHLSRLSPQASVLVVAVLVAAGAALATLVRLMFVALAELVEQEGTIAGAAATGDADTASGASGEAAPASTGSPTALDVRELDEQGVRAAPVERFADMTEDEALELASHAMDGDDPDKAQAILDRYDEARDFAAPVGADETTGTDESATGTDESTAGAPGAAAGAEGGEASGSVVSSTAAGMMDAFTEEETTEEDIGGYYYDIAFVLDSLTSRAFRIVGLFMAVLAGVFFWLYRGGIGNIQADFLSRLPEGIQGTAEEWPVTLHPVEALIFEIKVSVIVAALATLPLVLYYAWPSLKERGFAAGDRDVLITWAGALFGGLVVGSALGYAYVAPTIISWLAADVIQAHMVIAYRISSFGWLIFLTTVGVGLLAVIPVTMVMFHRGGLVSYRTIHDRWRVVTLGVFAVIAFLSPRGVFMMFILGIPVLLAYALGLGIIWAYTLGGRREPRRKGQRAD